MKRRVATIGACIAMLLLCAASALAGTVFDVDFNSWTSTYSSNAFATYTATVGPLEGTTGECLLSDITDDGMILRAANIKTDYENTGDVRGDPFTLSINYLAGPNGLPNQSVGLVVAENGSIWYDDLGTVTGGATWKNFSGTGNFDPKQFALLEGTGVPDFSGEVPMEVGLYTHQQQGVGQFSDYYQTFIVTSANLTPVPEPGTIALAAAVAVLGCRRYARRS